MKNKWKIPATWELLGDTQEGKEYLSNKRKEHPQDCFKWGIAIVWGWAWKRWIARGVKSECMVPCGWSQALLKAMFSCGNADLAAQVVPLPGSQPAACALCSSTIDPSHLCWVSGSCGTQVGQHLHWNPSVHSGSLEVTCLSWCWAWAVSLRSVGPAYKCGSFGSSSLLLVSPGITHWHQ